VYFSLKALIFSLKAFWGVNIPDPKPIGLASPGRSKFQSDFLGFFIIDNNF
jgi:hypothetical protein